MVFAGTNVFLGKELVIVMDVGRCVVAEVDNSELDRNGFCVFFYLLDFM